MSQVSNSFKQHYNRLNDKQKEAVDTLDGALLVLAGPGTGKTQLLSVRAANIIQQKKANPENILILTFSNAAASAMRERLAEIIGHDGYNVEVETFHSFANSIVLESEEALKYVKDKIEISEIEKIKALEYIMDTVKGVEPLKPFGAPYIHRREIEKRISELKNEGILPDEFKDSLKSLQPDGINLEEKHISRLNALAIIYEYYEKLKDEKSTILFDERGRIDYDDMILIALDALSREKELKDNFRRQYKYIMIDEFQDTNGAQLELIFSIMNPENANVCCVGDDDQSIYRFQGATLSNFRNLKERVPSIKTVELECNYRSTDSIIKIANEVITQLPEKERISVKKLKSCREYDSSNRVLEFKTEEEELAFIVKEIKRHTEIIKKNKSISVEERTAPYNNIAVLVRKRRQILKVIDAFLRAGIPYATDGKEDIRSEKRVRQVLDVLELASINVKETDKKSLALYKVLSSDYVGAFHSDVLKFVEFVNGQRYLERGKKVREYMSINLFQKFVECFPVDSEKKPLMEESKKLEIVNKLEFQEPHALHKAAWAINRLLTDAGNKPVHDLLMQYIEDVSLYRYILREYEQDKVLRLRDLRSLVSFINMIKEADLANPALGLDDFMEELTLREVHGMPLQGEIATQSQDGVRLYTSHAAKGLEFYTVFIPFCLQRESWPVRRKGAVVPLPPDIYKVKERASNKDMLKNLDIYDELRLFYVASTRARANLIFTASPREKVVVSQFLNHVNITQEFGSPKNEEQFLVNFLENSKDRDPFVNADDVLKSMVANLTLNPTSLNNYISCRRKFLYDNVLRLPGRKTQNLVFGNCAHEALEEVYAGFMKTGNFPGFSDFKNFFKHELEYHGVKDEIKRMCLDKLDTVSDWYKIEERSPVMPVDLEKKLEVILSEGLLFRGTFDKIEEEDNGSIRIVDYKTGKPDKHIKAIANCRDLAQYECDDYYRQLVAYKLLYEKHYSKEKNKVVTEGMLQFLEPVSTTVKKYDLEKGTYRNEVVRLTDDMVVELDDVIKKCWKNIKALKFDKLQVRDNSERCKWCAYDDICWG